MSLPRFAVRRACRLLLVCALPLLGACGKAPAPNDPPRPVLTMVVGQGGDASGVSYSGEVRSQFESPLAFRVPGKISARLVDAGAVVRPGDILARLDPADLALNAAAAQAQFELAEADVRRFRELQAKQFVSQAALDAKETAFRAAQAQSELARNQNAYAVLRADQAGVVAQVQAEAGQVVSAGQVVVRVARADTLEVAIAVPESRMREMRPGMTAEVALWADAQARYSGVVRELATVADAQTRTYAARVSIKAPDERVLLGMTANVHFPATGVAGQQAALAVPLGAVFQQDGKPAVWIVGEDKTVALRRIGVRQFREADALLETGESGGLKAGERIVVAGVHKLRAGETIKAVDRVSAAVK